MDTAPSRALQAAKFCTMWHWGHCLPTVYWGTGGLWPMEWTQPLITFNPWPWSLKKHVCISWPWVQWNKLVCLMLKPVWRDPCYLNQRRYDEETWALGQDTLQPFISRTFSIFCIQASTRIEGKETVSPFLGQSYSPRSTRLAEMIVPRSPSFIHALKPSYICGVRVPTFVWHLVQPCGFP